MSGTKKINKIERFVLLLIGMTIAIVVLACSPKESETKNLVDLTGRVTGTDTTVYLSDVFVYQAGTGGLTDSSDENGYFELDGIPFGPTSVYFEKDGYQKYELTLEYTGELVYPLVTKWIRMKMVGEVEPVVADTIVTDSM